MKLQQRNCKIKRFLTQSLLNSNQKDLTLDKGLTEHNKIQSIVGNLKDFLENTFSTKNSSQFQSHQQIESSTLSEKNNLVNFIEKRNQKDQLQQKLVKNQNTDPQNKKNLKKLNGKAIKQHCVTESSQIKSNYKMKKTQIKNTIQLNQQNNLKNLKKNIKLKCITANEIHQNKKNIQTRFSYTQQKINENLHTQSCKILKSQKKIKLQVCLANKINPQIEKESYKKKLVWPLSKKDQFNKIFLQPETPINKLFDQIKDDLKYFKN